jgi:Na+-transporting NADH:ubiquinone oxidoreductase subunit E
VPAPLRGLGITFIITGLMAIGFMSFGGMLTGGDEESSKKEISEVVTDSTIIEDETSEFELITDNNN